MITSQTSAAWLTIRLFGPMQALVQGHPLLPMHSRKGLWLLALLALRHDRPVEREWLAATLWPDSDQRLAFTNLRKILSELRGRLGDQSERLQAPSRHRLRLDLAGADVDVIQFDAAIKSEKRPDLQHAVALYRGPLLEGCAEEWVFQERVEREHRCLQALQKLGDAALSGGDYAQAVGYYQQAVGIDPWGEAARRGWMEALARSGDTNAALQVYREFVEVLKSDPRAVPDAQTSALYQRLRSEARQRAGTQAVVPAEVVATPVVKGYLPHPLTELVGREDERMEVTLLLRRCRLVTLTGMGGIGKTRLAREVADEVAREYADGVWLVALEALSEGRQVVRQIASVLGLKEEPGRTPLQSVTEHLRTKHLLLVLDNCEHLLKASGQVVAHLLQECAKVRILATSREALGITGETAWAVPALTTPDPAHLPQARATLLRVLMGYESVQMFVERAQAVQKTFALSGSNARTVTEVCRSLEGIPLAIELAAARVKAMTVEQIASRLDDHLGLLTVGSRTALLRQQTLRATLDWSYALLSEPERSLLRRLSVFVGGWRLEAAEQVCSGEGVEEGQVLNLLTSLVDKSLVTFEEREPADGRYRLLEMVRQYAGESLQASIEEKQVKKKHRDWCVAFVEEADMQLNGAEQEKWLGHLDREYDNLRGTLNWNEVEAEDEEANLQIMGALWRFWQIRGYYNEGRQYLQRALERQEIQQNTAVRARALNGAGSLANRQGDYAAARELYQQSLNIYRKLGNRRAVASSLNNQGNVARAQGDYATARALMEESLSIHRELENSVGIAYTLSNLGLLAQGQGDYAAAQTLFEESLSLQRQLGDQRGIAHSLENFGTLSILQGKYTEAQILLEESLSIFSELGDKYGIALSLGNLGTVAKDRGDPASARLLLEECLTRFKELGDKQGIALTLGNLGALAIDQGDYTLAQTLLGEGLTLLRQLGDNDGIATSLFHLGLVTQARGDSASARVLLQESLVIRHTMGNRLGVAESLEGLATVMLAQTEMQPAMRLWGAAHALREQIGAPLPPNAREECDQHVAQARSALGADAFAAAWEEGRTMAWEHAVAYALEEAK